jgi:hypothetical protein
MRISFVNTLSSLAILMAGAGIALFAVWQNLLLECVPHDEGLLGQSALRVMHGELPHRDFDDPYTGLLNLIHIAAFKIWGVHASSLRYLHLGVFSIVLSLFTWYVRPLLSLRGTILAIWSFTAWSILIYPASMPSWYISYLVFFAALLILKSNRKDFFPICAAGVLFGLATLIKINSIFFFTAGTWGLYYLASSQKENSRPALFFEKVILCLLFLVTNGLILYVLKHSLDLTHLAYYLLPNLVLTSFLVRKSFSENISSFIPQLCMFGGAYLLTICCYALYFYSHDGLMELLHGVFVSPMARVENASFPPPHWILQVIILSCLLFFVRIAKKEGPKSLVTILCISIASIGFFLVPEEKSIALALISLTPHAIILSLFLFGTSRSSTTLFWLLCASFGTLIQFPFYTSAYVGFISLFTILALLHRVHESSFPGTTRVFQELLLIVLFFGGLANSGISLNGTSFLTRHMDYEITPQRNQKPPYCIFDELIDVIRVHSKEGDTILAFPDSPEVYFFSERKNPTRRIYDFLSLAEDPYLLYKNMVSDEKPSLVVINSVPAGSPEVPKKITDFLADEYPLKKEIGNYTIFFQHPVN